MAAESGHDDCRVCQVVVDPLPHEPEGPRVTWDSRADALGKLDRDPDLPDWYEAS
jgi:hypothetical protein